MRRTAQQGVSALVDSLHAATAPNTKSLCDLWKQHLNATGATLHVAHVWSPRSRNGSHHEFRRTYVGFKSLRPPRSWCRLTNERHEWNYGYELWMRAATGDCMKRCDRDPLVAPSCKDVLQLQPIKDWSDGLAEDVYPIRPTALTDEARPQVPPEILAAANFELPQPLRTSLTTAFGRRSSLSQARFSPM